MDEVLRLVSCGCSQKSGVLVVGVLICIRALDFLKGRWVLQPGFPRSQFCKEVWAHGACEPLNPGPAAFESLRSPDDVQRHHGRGHEATSELGRAFGDVEVEDGALSLEAERLATILSSSKEATYH